MSRLTRQKIQWSAPEFRSNPFEAFRRLRDKGPLVPARMAIVGDIWLATTYLAADEVLKNDQLFCRDPRNAGRRFLGAIQWIMPVFFRRISQSMISVDEPQHRRLRSLVDQAFQQQRINQWQPRISQLVDQQLDQVAQIAARHQGEVDLMEHLARPVPMSVIGEVLGLPANDRARFKEWFASFAQLRSPWGILKVVPGLRKSMNYLREQFAQARQKPGDGLISALVASEVAGDRLTEDELLSMVTLLLLAGHETTVHLIGNAILTLLQNGSVRRALQRDWTQVEDAVEEILRWTSPVQFAKPRFVTVETEFHGQRLRRGEAILPLLASANYDPDRFERPEEFVLNRTANYHLAFGSGPHVCLGLKLARMETQIVLERMFTRWRELQPAFDISQPDWSPRMGMRSLRTLNTLLPDRESGTTGRSGCGIANR